MVSPGNVSLCLLLSSVVISLSPSCVDFLWSSDSFLLVPPMMSVHSCPQSFPPWFPIMSSMVVLSHFRLGSPSCLFILVLSFSPWFPIMSVHGCPQLCSPWFPTMSVHHRPHFPLGSLSVHHCPQWCSPWFLICLSLSSFVFPMVPHRFIIVFICVPLGFPSCRCSFFTYSLWFLRSCWFPICLSLSSVVFPLVPHDVCVHFPQSYSLWFLHHVCSSVQQSTGLGGQRRHVSFVDLLKSQRNFRGFLPA